MATRSKRTFDSYAGNDSLVDYEGERGRKKRKTWLQILSEPFQDFCPNFERAAQLQQKRQRNTMTGLQNMPGAFNEQDPIDDTVEEDSNSDDAGKNDRLRDSFALDFRKLRLTQQEEEPEERPKTPDKVPELAPIKIDQDERAQRNAIDWKKRWDDAEERSKAQSQQRVRRDVRGALKWVTEKRLREQREREAAQRKAEEEAKRKAAEEEAERRRKAKSTVIITLPEHDAQDIDEIWADPQAEDAEQLGNTTGLSVKDLCTTKPNTWLNDQVVNVFLRVVTQRVKEQKRYIRGKRGDYNPPPIHCFDTHMYNMFNEKGWSSVRRWWENGGLSGTKMLQCPLIIIPINPGSHWTMAIVNGPERTITHYDSLGSSRSSLRNVEQLVRANLGDAYDEEEWEHSLLQGASNQQTNTDDCGVFAVMNALAVILGKVPLDEVRADDMLAARRYLCWTVYYNKFFQDAKDSLPRRYTKIHGIPGPSCKDNKPSDDKPIKSPPPPTINGPHRVHSINGTSAFAGLTTRPMANESKKRDGIADGLDMTKAPAMSFTSTDAVIELD